MSGLELARPREIPEMFRDAVRVYLRHFATFVAVAAAVVVPAQLVVSGIGLEKLSAPYDDSLSPGEAVIPTLVSFLVVAPLITAITIHALRDVAGEGRPSAGRALTAGFEEFTPLFLAVVLAAIGIALGLALLVVPGVFLAVRWFFVPQTVVVEGARGAGALRRSGELVRNRWWRTCGIVLLANLAALPPGLLIGAPLEAAARAADRELWSLAGEILTETVVTPFVALVATLLYFDLRAREATA